MWVVSEAPVARLPNPILGHDEHLRPRRSASEASVEPMDKANATIAIFADHEGAEAAVKTLAKAGFDIKDLSVVGHGYHTDEKVAGFYNIGDRVKFWGARGAFWAVSGASFSAAFSCRSPSWDISSSSAISRPS